MKLNVLSVMVMASIVMSQQALAEDVSPLPVEVVNPDRLDAQGRNPVVEAAGVIGNSVSGSGQVSPMPVNVPDENALLLQMAAASNKGQPIGGMSELGIAEEWANQVKGKYSPEQKLNLRPGANVKVPVALGLMNRFETSFTSVSVKTNDESAVLEVDRGIFYATLNSRNPLNVIVMEEGVPESAVNVTLIPVDVPPAMVKMKVAMTSQQLQEAFSFQQKRKQEEITAQASEEEEQIKRSDRHTERLKEILAATALGQIPAGFVMSNDDIKALPYSYQHPCVTSMSNVLGQRMVGAREIIDVVLLYNKSTLTQSFKEESCRGHDTLAVAVMDASRLAPGAKTEVYIVRDKNWFQNQQKLQTRPRLTGDNSLGISGYSAVPAAGVYSGSATSPAFNKGGSSYRHESH